jgi:hypothetical protein
MFTSSIIRVITLMMEAVGISETLVYSKETTQCYIPEDSKLHNHYSVSGGNADTQTTSNMSSHLLVHSR